MNEIYIMQLLKEIEVTLHKKGKTVKSKKEVIVNTALLIIKEAS